MGIDMITAAEDKIFVLTKKGQYTLPPTIIHERKAGDPVRGYEMCVPKKWLKDGLVIEEYEW